MEGSLSFLFMGQVLIYMMHDGVLVPWRFFQLTHVHASGLWVALWGFQGNPSIRWKKISTVTEFRTTSLWLLCILCNKQTEGILEYNGLKRQVWLSFVSD